MGELARVYLSCHTPRYCNYDAAFGNKISHPDFQPVRDGLVEQGRDVAAAKPDVIFINSCHLVTTFPTVVDGTPRHRDILTAQEIPDVIRDVEYDFPGDLELAHAVIEKGKAADHLCTLANDPHYPLDYGTVMPLVLYLDRSQQIPVVPISVCLASDLEECSKWGRYIVQAVRESDKTAAFVASGSVSHKLARKPEKWPEPEDRELDQEFERLMTARDFEKVWQWLPEFSKQADVEMGGRHLAMMLGAILEAGGDFKTTVHAYGPSSGSGNYIMTMAANAG